MAASAVPQVGEAFFDPHLKRLVTINEIWEKHLPELRQTTLRCDERVTALQDLGTLLTEALSVAVLREGDVIRRIKSETDTHIQVLKRRERELCELVANDSASQMKKLEAAIASVLKAKELLVPQFVAMKGQAVENASAPQSIHHRLAALYQCMEQLKNVTYFHLPEPATYSVSAVPIPCDHHLSVARRATPIFPPPALAVAPAPQPSSGTTSPRGYHATHFSANTVHCAYSSAMEGCHRIAPGILYYIATGGRTRAFTNPFQSNIVTLYADFVEGSEETIFSDILAKDSLPVETRTKSVKGARIVFDFGISRRVDIHQYVLRHGHSTKHAALRTWRLVGWNGHESEAAPEEVVLDLRNGVATLGVKPWAVAMFQVEKHKRKHKEETFRFIALEITGPNSAGDSTFHIELSHIDFFGILVTT